MLSPSCQVYTFKCFNCINICDKLYIRLRFKQRKREKVEKEKAWEEIFKYLDDEYEIKTAVEKKETGNNIFLKLLFRSVDVTYIILHAK